MHRNTTAGFYIEFSPSLYTNSKILKRVLKKVKPFKRKLGHSYHLTGFSNGIDLIKYQWKKNPNSVIKI